MGDAQEAGAFSGFSAARTTISVFCISGACAGVAGMVEVSANMGQLQPEVSFGYGFTAIIVAFLARLNPLGVIAAGLVIALAELGGDSVQMTLGMPKVVTGVFKGILLFMLLAGETFNRYQFRISWVPAAGGPGVKGAIIMDALVLTVLLTSVPLILAATGELIAEKSGVLNLGVEGMMLMGAVAAFAVTSLSGNPYFGIICSACLVALQRACLPFLLLGWRQIRWQLGWL